LLCVPCSLLLLVCLVCEGVCACVGYGGICFEDALLLCASCVWVMWGVSWQGALCRDVGCALKVCFGGYFLVVCVVVVVWSCPVWCAGSLGGCGMLSRCVCGEIVCVVCDFGGGVFCCVMCFVLGHFGWQNCVCDGCHLCWAVQWVVCFWV